MKENNSNDTAKDQKKKIKQKNLKRLKLIIKGKKSLKIKMKYYHL